jgi:hypothetical protein
VSCLNAAGIHAGRDGALHRRGRTPSRPRCRPISRHARARDGEGARSSVHFGAARVRPSIGGRARPPMDRCARRNSSQRDQTVRLMTTTDHEHGHGGTVDRATLSEPRRSACPTAWFKPMTSRVAQGAASPARSLHTVAAVVVTCGPRCERCAPWSRRTAGFTQTTATTRRTEDGIKIKTLAATEVRPTGATDRRRSTRRNRYRRRRPPITFKRQRPECA